MRKLIIPILVTIFIVVSMTYIYHTPPTVLTEAPKVVLGEIEGFTSKALEPSEAELLNLPSDTGFVKRLYTASDGNWVLVSAVIGGTSKRSIHRPELCLAGQGYRMTEPRSRNVDGVEWRLITLDGGVNRPSLGFAYTFFNQEGYHTSSHLRRIFRDIWDRSVYNRIDRWVMITVNSSIANETLFQQILTGVKGALK